MDTIPDWLAFTIFVGFVFLAVVLSWAKFKQWRTGVPSLLDTVYDIITFW